MRGDKVRSKYTEEEVNKMGEKNEGSNDLLLESLRLNLEKVRKEKMELESKELEIKKQINRLTQGE